MPPRPGKFQRAIGIAKTMLPIVGNLLPLLEGNVVGAASNLIANRGGNDIDLKPLHEAIASLQSDQRALTFHSGEQKRALRRIEEEFIALQESVQKHAADQAELAEQVVKLARRTSTFMRLVTILLVLSILVTTALVIRIAYIIRF
jgi:cytochrome c-type biogenesis protein CcmH/NrfG